MRLVYNDLRAFHTLCCALPLQALRIIVMAEMHCRAVSSETAAVCCNIAFAFAFAYAAKVHD